MDRMQLSSYAAIFLENCDFQGVCDYPLFKNKKYINNFIINDRRCGLFIANSILTLLEE